MQLALLCPRCDSRPAGADQETKRAISRCTPHHANKADLDWAVGPQNPGSIILFMVRVVRCDDACSIVTLYNRNYGQGNAARVLRGNCMMKTCQQQQGLLHLVAVGMSSSYGTRHQRGAGGGGHMIIYSCPL